MTQLHMDTTGWDIRLPTGPLRGLYHDPTIPEALGYAMVMAYSAPATLDTAKLGPNLSTGRCHKEVLDLSQESVMAPLQVLADGMTGTFKASPN